VRHSIFLSIVPEGAGRFWWAVDDDSPGGGSVVGFAMQSPPGFSAGVTPCAGPVIDALCDAIVADVPDLPGVIAEASVAAWFAGRWAERRAVPARPTESQRVYCLDRLVPRPPVPGRLRPGTTAERDGLVRWGRGFAADVDFMPEDPETVVDRHLAHGRLWLWENGDGEMVSMAAASPPTAGVSRIGFVYTPPEHRQRGYATACVAALTALLLADGGADRCMLYAQLHNPTSNAIYRRMGYQPVADILFYRFGDRTPA
jgi:GNAT superfamily N-acetyltransferase